jgi:hypothetical protein
LIAANPLGFCPRTRRDSVSTLRWSMQPVVPKPHRSFLGAGHLLIYKPVRTAPHGCPSAPAPPLLAAYINVHRVRTMVNSCLSNVRRFDRPAMARLNRHAEDAVCPCTDHGRRWPYLGRLPSAIYVEQERTFAPSAPRRAMMVPCGVAFHRWPEATNPDAWKDSVRRCRARHGTMFGGAT